MKKFYFLLGSEHQLFQVKEAIRHFNIPPDQLILILEEDSRTDDFIKKISTQTTYKNVFVFQSWTFKDILLDRHKYRDFHALCLTFGADEGHLFASHYDTDSTLLFLNIVKPHRFYLMDEGTASFAVCTKRQHQSFWWKHLVKSMLYRKWISAPARLTYFTKYHLENKKTDQLISYEILKTANPLTFFDETSTLYLGSSIVELQIMREKDYLGLLQNLKHKQKIKKLIYVPHRKEGPVKLKKIEALGFEIYKINMPFELYSSGLTSCPSINCSFYTTAVLDNLTSTNQTLPKLIIYTFDTDLLLKERAIYHDISKHLMTNTDLHFEKLFV